MKKKKLLFTMKYSRPAAVPPFTFNLHFFFFKWPGAYIIFRRYKSKNIRKITFWREIRVENIASCLSFVILLLEHEWRILVSGYYFIGRDWNFNWNCCWWMYYSRTICVHFNAMAINHIRKTKVKVSKGGCNSHNIEYLKCVMSK